MIAVISSTIYPANKPTYDGQRSRIGPQERLEQTQKTVASLVDVGVTKIYLADNSGQSWVAGTETVLKPAKTYVFNGHQYYNTGISELYLLLSIVPYLPSGEPIIKISGRYTLHRDIRHLLGDADLAGKVYHYRSQFPIARLSTRCYLVKNKDVFETFLKMTLREVYAYPSRVVGPRSLLRILRNSLLPNVDDYPYDDPIVSIEGAAARVLKIHRYRYREINQVGIEGYIHGNPTDMIRE